MPKKETKILVITLLLIDIIFAGIFIFIFSFTKNLIAESINGENTIKDELKSEDTATLMKNDLVSAKIFQQKMADYMVSSGGTVDFIKILEQLVSNSGLKYNINTVASVPYTKDVVSNIELLKIDMDATGDWNSIQFFLASLENYPLKIDINNISLTKSSDDMIKGKNIPQWSLSLEFTVVKIKDSK